MPEAGSIEIEVAFAGPEKQIIRSLQVPAGTTAREALCLSGLADECTAIDIDAVTLGVFGRVVPGSYAPCAGERIEVYRPLRRDPREARKKRCP
jgi:putative ubiquitin-RnfH superfamily antitoxin RatB of RatAB toxin-antitoxin module